jgi:hypothetical protein
MINKANLLILLSIFLVLSFKFEFSSIYSDYSFAFFESEQNQNEHQSNSQNPLSNTGGTPDLEYDDSEDIMLSFLFYFEFKKFSSFYLVLESLRPYSPFLEILTPPPKLA